MSKEQLFRIKTVFFTLVFSLPILFIVNQFLKLNLINYVPPLIVFSIGAYLYAYYIQNNKLVFLISAAILFVGSASFLF
ncbi:hypothetical protein [Vagococcus hydrophili]|uniref:Uncharacterized protein n=1 Tax=Vagococcus hydrophili TaxID=2714947 RepID=A0A6G8AT15_9ENTE|nr:hypothetical protein [Vagococcus hydrophili]QIL48120.1 hypothetical protein G7082_06120 [Vagococcus hydrophili]